MITDTLKELYRLFDLFNKELFEGKLSHPIILIQTHKKAYGTFCNNAWSKIKDKTKLKHEITINPEYLNRHINEICSTLIHEMTHQYCVDNSIKDTSNNNVYHNKKFKEEAEKRGLNISHEKTIGWSITKLKPSTEKLIQSFKINDKVFDYYRTSNLKIKVKTITYKYICPCEIKISHYKPINLVCGECNKPFELSNAEEIQLLKEN